MKKSKWLVCQGNEFFPKQKGTPSLVKIEHKNTATLDSARSKKKLKSQFCNYLSCMLHYVLHSRLLIMLIDLLHIVTACEKICTIATIRPIMEILIKYT